LQGTRPPKLARYPWDKPFTVEKFAGTVDLIGFVSTQTICGNLYSSSGPKYAVTEDKYWSQSSECSLALIAESECVVNRNSSNSFGKLLYFRISGLRQSVVQVPFHPLFLLRTDLNGVPYGPRKTILRSDRLQLRKPRVATAIRLGIAFIAVLAAWPQAAAAAADAPTGKPQIQGGNLHIEFDNQLRSRVIVRFGKTEIFKGPFTASETVTAPGKTWAGFLMSSQELRTHEIHFWRGERLTEEGKTGALLSPYTTTSPRWCFSTRSTPIPGKTSLSVKL